MPGLIIKYNFPSTATFQTSMEMNNFYLKDIIPKFLFVSFATEYSAQISASKESWEIAGLEFELLALPRDLNFPTPVFVICLPLES